MMIQVADGVSVHRSELLQNNTVVVSGGTGVLLVDPGITNAEMACLADDLMDPVVAGFATHPDWDHTLWHPAFGDAPRYGTARCATAMEELLSRTDRKEQIVEVMPPEIVDDIPLELLGLITGLPGGTTEIPWDGTTVRILAHRAHAVGHAALVIPDRGVLVAGDMLSDVLVPMLDLDAADPIQDYLEALQLLEDAAAEVSVVVPGHGSVASGDRIQQRIEKDRAYVQALREGRSPDDPRIGPAAAAGWEWVADVHAWQQQSLAGRAG